MPGNWRVQEPGKLANNLSQDRITQEITGECRNPDKLANKLSQVRMAQETISPSTQGHW